MSRSLEKALRLLQSLSASTEHEWHGVPLKALAADTELDKATAHRLLRSLAKFGYVVQDGDGRYALGYGALALAHGAYRSNRLVRRVIEAMRTLHATTDETINLAEVHGSVSVTVHEIASTQQVRYTTRIGAVAPLHLGASSRATLAFSPEALTQAVLSAPLEQATRDSVTDAAELERTLQQVRADGYAVSFGERVPNTNSIAVPLLANDGHAVGSLAILWPSRGSETDERRRREWPALLVKSVSDVQGTL